MVKLLEIVFRHLILFLLILLVPVIISLRIGYMFSDSYQASATLWALQQYKIIGVTDTQSNTQEALTPAVTQTTALSELLQTGAFDILVGQSTDLKSTFKLSSPDSQALNDAYIADISKNAQVVSKGNNLYEISYTNGYPRIAFQVVNAIITQFQTQGQQLRIIEDQQLLQSNQSQLTVAKKNATIAANNEAAYLATHPGINQYAQYALIDTQYAMLDAQRVQTQSLVTKLQSTIVALNQEIAATKSTDFFKTLDAPIIPEPTSRTKQLMIASGIGTAIGLFVCFISILILIRRDHALYTTLDVEKVTSYPVLIQAPRLTRKGTNALHTVTSDTTKNKVIVS